MGRFFQAERSVNPTTHPASRVCSVSKPAGPGFFDGLLKFAGDGKIEHGKVAWPRDKLGETRRSPAETVSPESCPPPPLRRPLDRWRFIGSAVGLQPDGPSTVTSDKSLQTRPPPTGSGAGVSRPANAGKACLRGFSVIPAISFGSI